MNGQYLGSYYLSENVRIDDNRIEIDELEETDVELPELAGGYLLQNTIQTEPDSIDIINTENGESWATHTPCFDERYDDDAYTNPAQQQYIQEFIQNVDDALFNEDYKAKDGTSYRDLMDIESAAKYWLVNQFSLNGDS